MAILNFDLTVNLPPNKEEKDIVLMTDLL